MNLLKKATLATALTASALASVTPAMARDHYGRRGDDTAAWAIGAGILGLAIGAAVASGADHDRDHRYDRRYYNGGDYTYRDGYYWDRYGNRYDRDWRRDAYRDDYRRGYDRNYYYDRRGY